MTQRLPLTPAQRRRTILRSDGGIGSDANVNWLLAHDYHILTKGFNHSRGEAQGGRRLTEEVWLHDAGTAQRWIAPAPDPPRFARRIRMWVVRWPTQQGYRYATLLYSGSDLPPLATWRLSTMAAAPWRSRSGRTSRA